MAERALTIGEVATRTGVSRRAIRLYEARRIVPKPRRTQAGYRVYDADALGILHFVTQARRLGLTLKEIGHIIDLRPAKPGPCVHVRALLEQKLIELDSLRREVKKILNGWDASSAQRGVVCQHIEGGKAAMDKISLCPACTACPEVVIDGDTVRIGEEGNIVSLKKAEWNVLVDVIKSGKVGKL